MIRYHSVISEYGKDSNTFSLYQFKLRIHLHLILSWRPKDSNELKYYQRIQKNQGNWIKINVIK